MPGHDIVVIGGSAGALEALLVIVEALPAGLEASLFVVIHTSAGGPGILPDLLQRRCRLRASYARDGEAIEPGRIYIAPSDRHLLVKRSRVVTPHGPKENLFRPAVDPLFRTAARAYGPRVVGVILSGWLDDGVRGLLVVKHHGGTAVAQSIEEAAAASMPLSAMQNVEVDHVARAREIGPLIVEMAARPVFEEVNDVMERESSEPDVSELGSSALLQGTLQGSPSAFTCPECGGSLWEKHEGKMSSYRCHVGHGYSAMSLLAEQADRTEDRLWQALRSIEEQAALYRHLGGQPGPIGVPAGELRAAARQLEERASVLRSLLVEKPDARGARVQEGAEPARAGRAPASARRKRR
ncbi:MAG TPA: chemotaxis protein CheB [Candidatus Polarisedimenticolia bacterium]|nr:chemotaxis protein CheB [Candidatus Polarisedimenticolia bacterium]